MSDYVVEGIWSGYGSRAASPRGRDPRVVHRTIERKDDALELDGTVFHFSDDTTLRVRAEFRTEEDIEEISSYRKLLFKILRAGLAGGEVSGEDLEARG